MASESRPAVPDNPAPDRPTPDDPAAQDHAADPADFEQPEAIVVEITDVIDLHTFRPSEMSQVARDYLDAAYDQGLRRLRIIHGRGVGAQRRSIRTLLERDSRVISYADAPPEDGGNGATLVILR